MEAIAFFHYTELCSGYECLRVYVYHIFLFVSERRKEEGMERKWEEERHVKKKEEGKEKVS